MGKFHPHGDQSIYDALARMAQDFSLRYPLVDGHGNFGSPDPNDRPAAHALHRGAARAARDAAARRDRRGHRRLRRRPTTATPASRSCCPARFPNLLVNGGGGIAVGMATNIPPHNLGEVIDATLHLHRQPRRDRRRPHAVREGPRLPDRRADPRPQRASTTRYRTGRGSIKMRAVAEIEEGRKGDQRIVVTEVPYQTSVEVIGQKIAELVNDRKIEGIRDVRNESSGDTARLVVELKRDANAQVVLNQLYKHTPMQTNFAVHMLALVDGVPRLLNLPTALARLRRAPDRGRHAPHRVPPAQGEGARAHRRGPGEGARHDRRDHRPDPRLRATPTPPAPALMATPFEFTEIQANYILDMQLRRLTAARAARSCATSSRSCRRRSRSSSRSSPSDGEAARGDQGRARRGARQVRRRAPHRAHRRHRRPRRPRPHRRRRGRRRAVAARATSRRSRPTRSARRAAAARACAAATCATRTTSSTCSPPPRTRTCCSSRTAAASYRLRAHEIPMKERTARGTALVNLIPLDADERIQAVIDTRTYEDGAYLFFATKQRHREEDEDVGVRLVAAHRADRDQPQRRRRAGAGDPDHRRRRHLHGVAATA